MLSYDLCWLRQKSIFYVDLVRLASEPVPFNVGLGCPSLLENALLHVRSDASSGDAHSGYHVCLAVPHFSRSLCRGKARGESGERETQLLNSS